MKNKKGTFIDKLAEAIEMYNSSYHGGIDCTPMEASNDKTGRVMVENSPEGKYAKRFKMWHCDKFYKGQIVRIAKKENLTGCDKYSKGRFLELGLIVEKCPKDSYIVSLNNGRLVKKRHYDLKRCK